MDIVCFSWNASGLRICESASQFDADKKRTGFRGLLKKPCIAPDFFENIRTYIKDKNPGVVVMTTQDEDEKDTYFHSDFLPMSMREIGYSLLKRDKMDGIGEKASKGPVTTSEIPTGLPSGSALRSSIYVRNNELESFKFGERKISKFFSDGQLEHSLNHFGRVSGAIASYLWHQKYGRIVFIATHLPSGSEALKVGRGENYEVYRVASVASNTLCLIDIMKKFITDIPKDYKPEHIFLMGDLNYDIVFSDKSTSDLINEISKASSMDKYRNNDELYKNIKEIPLKGFKEGINDNGPQFKPTCRLSRSRGEESSNEASSIPSSCFESSDLGIGWHDRILYRDLDNTNYKIKCNSYSRLDVKNMQKSTHAGVLGHFTIE